MLVASGVHSAAAAAVVPPFIGTIQTVAGYGTVARSNCGAIQVKVGDPVYHGDVIETASGGRIGIRLIDDTLFHVFSDAHLELRQFGRDLDDPSCSTLFAVTRGSFAFIAGRLGSEGFLTIDTPHGRLRGRSHAGGFGILTLAALTFSMMTEANAADPDATFLDDDKITYKDLQHGVFELTTKEAVPRHIVVEDPGETVVLNRIGSSVSVSQTANSATRMEELQAAQQDVLANLTRGPSGSSTPPSGNLLPVQHITFAPDSQPSQTNLLPQVQPIDFPVPEVMIIRPPPTLGVPAGPVYIDTRAFNDTFAATSGAFSASSPSSGATLTYGLSGGTAGSTILNGLTYDLSQTGPYGTLYVNSTTGAYTFVPNNDAINAQSAPTATDFVITVSDGWLSANQTFRVTVIGVNDAAAITGSATGSVVEASGAANATSGTPTATGTLTDVDVDNPSNTFTAVSTPTKSTSGYGSFTMTAAGVWTYTLNNDNGSVQALNVGDTLTDSFTVTSIDGTPQVVTITILGRNDTAIISGAAAGSVVEASETSPGTPIATGTLADVDVDNPPNTFTAVNSPATSSGGYGNYTITAAGAWTYTLDNTNTTVQALNGGETLTDSFTVATIDGTTQVVRITITGSNDAAVISGTATGSVIEAGGVANALTGTPTAIGLLTDADPDNTSNTFTAVTSPTASAGGFGTFTVTASGAWNYTLDNSNSSVQGLNVGGTLTDTFIVTTIDGTPQLVTITINGTNDAAIVFGTTTGSVIEAGGSSPGTPIATGALADTDVDNPANTFTAVTSPAASDGGYGTFTMTAAGVWTYTLDNNNFVVDALNVGDTLTDSFTITSIDGTPQEVTITIHGSSDADPNDFDYLAAGSAVVSDPPFVYGTPGSDTVAGGGDVTQIVYGGAGADTLNGTGVNDIIYGGSGNDTIKGNNGDDVIYGGSGNDTINGSNGNDKIIGGFGADALTGGNGNDIFVYLSATDSRAGQFDTVSDFISGSDKIDLTAMGALGFVILALNSTSTSVPAHTIAWIYDSSANETIVYVNSTDHTLDIGDSSLLEIHLQGIATIEASDFILDAPVAPVVAAGDVVDPTVTTQSDGTIGTTTLSASSDLTGGTGTIVSDGSSILPAAGASFTVDAHNSQSRSVDHSTSSSDEPEPQSALLERTDAPTPVEFKSTLEQRGVADSNHAGAIGTGGMATEDRAMLNFAFALDASQIGANPHANASTVGNAHSHASEAIALSPGLVEVLENGDHGHSMAAEAHANSSNALLHGPSPLDAELFPAAHGASSSQDPGARGLGDSFHFKGLDMALERTLPASTPNDPVAPLHGHEHAAGANRFDAAPTNEDSLPGDGTHPMGGTVHSHVSHDLIV